ncbi:MAG: DUF503 domain-containing protein [Myxococcales bacterium]|nr:MAG: DUF503 domain-containing protein [Myxococcales bacterium]
MVVGTLKLTVHLHMGASLKDKRSEVKRILARVKQRAPVAFAETGQLDKWQLTELGFACVSNDSAVCERILDSVEEEIESKADATISDRQRELLHL